MRGGIARNTSRNIEGGQLERSAAQDQANIGVERTQTPF
jgi:hypothetical protein